MLGCFHECPNWPVIWEHTTVIVDTIYNFCASFVTFFSPNLTEAHLMYDNNRNTTMIIAAGHYYTLWLCASE